MALVLDVPKGHLISRALYEAALDCLMIATQMRAARVKGGEGAGCSLRARAPAGWSSQSLRGAGPRWDGGGAKAKAALIRAPVAASVMVATAWRRSTICRKLGCSRLEGSGRNGEGRMNGKQIFGKVKSRLWVGSR